MFFTAYGTLCVCFFLLGCLAAVYPEFMYLNRANAFLFLAGNVYAGSSMLGLITASIIMEIIERCTRK